MIRAWLGEATTSSSGGEGQGGTRSALGHPALGRGRSLHRRGRARRARGADLRRGLHRQPLAARGVRHGRLRLLPGQVDGPDLAATPRALRGRARRGRRPRARRALAAPCGARDRLLKRARCLRREPRQTLGPRLVSGAWGRRRSPALHVAAGSRNRDACRLGGGGRLRPLRPRLAEAVFVAGRFLRAPNMRRTRTRSPQWSFFSSTLGLAGVAAVAGGLPLPRGHPVRRDLAARPPASSRLRPERRSGRCCRGSGGPSGRTARRRSPARAAPCPAVTRRPSAASASGSS